jgi:uncharacterized protein YjiS (DUF1127 family)
MWPSRFIEQMTPAPGAKPKPFEFELQAWLGPVLVPSVAIERAFHTARQATDEEHIAAPKPRRPDRIALLATWRKRVNFRQELARLLVTCPHMIADIGLTREAAEAEIARPFWRASPQRGFGVTTIGGGTGAKVTGKPRALVG